MKKVKWVLIAGLVVVVVLVSGVFIYINQIAKAAVEQGSTYALGVDTTLDSADIAIVAGRSQLNGLTVSNPGGYESPHFLALGEGAMAVRLGSLREETIELPEFTLSGIDVHLEKKSGKANYEVIMDNLKRFESKEQPTEEQAEEQQGSGKKFVIRRVVIKDVTAHLSLLPIGGNLTKLTVQVPEIQLKDVGSDSDQGVMIAQLTDTLIKAILMAVIEKGGKEIPQELLNSLQGGLAQLQSISEVGAEMLVQMGDGMKQITGGVGEMMQGAATQAGQAAEQLGQAAEQGAKQLGEGAKQVGQEMDKAVKDTGKAIEEGIGGLLKPTEKEEPQDEK